MRKNIVYAVFSVFVTAGIFAWLFSHITLREVADLLRNVDPRGVALFLLASLGMSFFRAWRYRVILRSSGFAPGRFAMYLVVLVRNTFSDFLPARLGTLVYIYIITTRLGIPFGAATSSFALAFIFDMLALVPLIAWAAVGLGGGSLWVLIGFGAVLTVAMVWGLAILPRLIEWMAARVGRLPLLGAARRDAWRLGLQAVREDLQRTRAAGIYGRVFMLSLMVRIFKYASLYLFLFALVAPLGYGWSRLPVAHVFTGLCAAEAAASLPISGLAGFGAYEGAWATVFRMLLFPAPLAKMTSIAHHLFTQLYGYSLGAVALLVLLLPLWRRVSPAPQTLPPKSPWRFTVQWAASWLAIAGLAAWLYQVCPAAEVADSGASLVIEAEQATALRQLREQISGWAVFERPEGVYLVRLGESEPRLLVAGGTFPRFSPDGEKVAFVRGREIAWIHRDGTGLEILAPATEPRAVSFHPNGRELCFTDGETIRAVNLSSREVQTVFSGYRFRELDVAPDGRIVVTVRQRGVFMMGFDPASGRSWRIASGCSASFSPDGRRVTNNDGNHRSLTIRDFETGRAVGSVSAPEGLAFDNQQWSNDENWMVSRSEGLVEEVFVHDLLKNTSFHVTYVKKADRPDVFIEKLQGLP